MFLNSDGKEKGILKKIELFLDIWGNSIYNTLA
jgi:hypothetical protein